MERHSNYENNNALTEVSLALAMAFFSIMVLSIYALSQSHISQNKKKIDIVNENKNPPQNEVNDNILIYYLKLISKFNTYSSWSFPSIRHREKRTRSKTSTK